MLWCIFQDKLRGKIRELQEENNRLRLSLHSHSSPTSASAAPAAAGRESLYIVMTKNISV